MEGLGGGGGGAGFGLGFRVYGSGRGYGFRFGVSGLRVSGFGFRISCLGLRGLRIGVSADFQCHDEAVDAQLHGFGSSRCICCYCCNTRYQHHPYHRRGASLVTSVAAVGLALHRTLRFAQTLLGGPFNLVSRVSKVGYGGF